MQSININVCRHSILLLYFFFQTLEISYRQTAPCREYVTVRGCDLGYSS